MDAANSHLFFIAQTAPNLIKKIFLRLLNGIRIDSHFFCAIAFELLRNYSSDLRWVLLTATPLGDVEKIANNGRTDDAPVVSWNSVQFRNVEHGSERARGISVTVGKDRVCLMGIVFTLEAAT